MDNEDKFLTKEDLKLLLKLTKAASISNKMGICVIDEKEYELDMICEKLLYIIKQ